MLMPAIGFIAGCAFFAFVGAIVLRMRRRGIGPKTMLPFIAGAMVAAAAAGWLYGVVVADEEGQLHGGGAILALFAVVLVAGVAGGLGAVFLLDKRRGA